jgi:hypothetical protein
MESRSFYETALKNCLTFDDVRSVWATTPANFLDDKMYIHGLEVSWEGKLLACIPEAKRTIEVCRTAIMLDCDAFPYIPDDVCDESIVYMAIQNGYPFWNMPSHWQESAKKINSELRWSRKLF